MSSAFIPALRGAFLYLSRQPNVRRWMETSRTARPLTRRFVAGLTLDDGLRVVRKLRADGMFATLDHLGENVTSLEDAQAAREAYLEALRDIAAGGLRATISVKATALGLDVSDDACRENLTALMRAAQNIGSRVEMDMEASAYTDRTLRLVREMHTEYGSVRAVIQAYLYRSEADVVELSQLGIPIRLCKGAYREPPTVAYAKKEDVDANYRKLMLYLLDHGKFPAIATHDQSIIDKAFRYVRSRGIAPDTFEFEMLYGVRRDLQKLAVKEGFQVRVYVPYGTSWYPYFMRRLAERPANALFIARALLQG